MSTGNGGGDGGLCCGLGVELAMDAFFAANAIFILMCPRKKRNELKSARHVYATKKIK